MGRDTTSSERVTSKVISVASSHRALRNSPVEASASRMSVSFTRTSG